VAFIEAMSKTKHFKEIISDNAGDYTNVQRACITRNIDIVKRLVSYGATVTEKNINGDHAFHICATLNSVKTLDYLLPFEKTVDIANNEGWTPAHIASFLGHGDFLSILIENGANLFSKHTSKMNCIHEVIRTGNTELFKAIYKYAIEENKLRNLNEVLVIPGKII
jgi:ankyrin repeat protein